MNDRPILRLPRKRGQAPTEPVAARSSVAAPQAPPTASEAAVAAMAWLRAAFPAAFASAVPLAIGIGRQLMKARPADISARGLKVALTRWVRRPAYLKALAAVDSMRSDLRGTPVEPVSDRHRQYAVELLARRTA